MEEQRYWIAIYFVGSPEPYRIDDIDRGAIKSFIDDLRNPEAETVCIFSTKLSVVIYPANVTFFETNYV